MGCKPPPQGWIKANVDVSVGARGHFAACGGVFRDSQGVWLTGFLKLPGCLFCFDGWVTSYLYCYRVCLAQQYQEALDWIWFCY